MRWVALAVLVGGLAIAAPASARKPVIAYVDASNKLALYDSETGSGVAAPDITIPNARDFAVSFDGRFIFYRDAAKKLHLYDRDIDGERALPGVDVFANPDRASVSDTGLVAFDAGDEMVRVYDAAVHAFVDTGIADDSKHRQPALSGDGRFLATTCLTGAGKCIGESPPDADSDSDLFVQNLTTRLDTALPDLPALDKDHEHPCVNGDGSLVGSDYDNKDLFLYDRSMGTDVTPVDLKTTTAIEVHCVLSAGGGFVGLDDNAGNFKMYDRTAAAFVALPATVTAPAWFTSPYEKPASPSGGNPPPGPGPGVADVLAPRLSKVSARPRRFRPRGAGGRGTLVRFTLSEPAKARIQILRGKRALFTRRRNAHAGASKIRLSGRVRRHRRSHALRPGRYVIRVLATDAAGNVARPVRLRVRVLR
jgi:hypothetical protein